MVVYVVTTSYDNIGTFGVYSTMKRARLAFEQYLNENDDIADAWVDTGDYTYQFYTKDDATFGAEIITCPLDEEFVEGIITDEEV